MKLSDVYCGTHYWRFLSYILTVVVFFLIGVDFLSGNSIGRVVHLSLLIYSGVLLVYSTEKEFERWQDCYSKGRHPGEWFVILWTLVIILLIFSDYRAEWEYHTPNEIFETYVLVITLLVITKKSKNIYLQKKESEQKPIL